MNELLIVITLIFFPGIIAAIICDKITVHKQWTQFKYLLYSFILGISSYAFLQLIIYLYNFIAGCYTLNWEFYHLTIWDSLLNSNYSINKFELLFGTLASIVVAYLFAYIVNHKILNGLARKLRVSTKYGDENLFSYYLNTENIVWVYVRDIKNNLTYQGVVVAFSETGNKQEIVLSDVTVYRYEDSARLYDVPTMYLSEESDSFIIEQVPENLLGEYNE